MPAMLKKTVCHIYICVVVVIIAVTHNPCLVRIEIITVIITKVT